MPQAKQQPEAKRRDLLSRFHAEYGEAMAAAQVSVEHTATGGWQALYQGFYKTHRDGRRKAAERLREHADAIEVGRLDEENEKDLADVKKELARLREEEEMFAARTVTPVKAPVDRCRDIINKARSQAQMEQDRAPLVYDGLVEELLQEIAQLNRPAWDAERGRVEIKPPPRD